MELDGNSRKRHVGEHEPCNVVDLGFVVGLMGWELTDDRFFDALGLAAASGLDVRFEVRPLAHPDHPNTVEIEMEAADGRRLVTCARSIGGGAVEVVEVEGWPVRLTGSTYELLVEIPMAAIDQALAILGGDGQTAGEIETTGRGGRTMLHARRLVALDPSLRTALEALGAGTFVREAPPIAFVKRGAQLFQSAAEMLALADARGWSLGRAALAYEAQLLGLGEQEVLAEVARRFDIMQAAVHLGLHENAPAMQLLAPSARAIFDADAAGRLPLGGLHTRAAARAMAVMHVNGAMGVVCAAPTGGSAGAVPGVVVTLVEERGDPLEDGSGGGSGSGGPGGGGDASPPVTIPADGGPWIAGRALAGPVCPVERVPPDPACADRPVAGAVIVVRGAAGAEVARVTTAADGTFLVAVPGGGSWTVEPQPVEGLMGTAPAVVVNVPDAPGAWVAADAAYDTGIR